MIKQLILEFIKRHIRLWDARLAWGRTTETFMDHSITFVRPHFWNDTDPDNYAVEIHPYFDDMPDLPEGAWVVDAGGASGQFSATFGVTNPTSHVIAFEPSLRQRILLNRNLRLNGLSDRATIQPFGLWNKRTTLAFRTHGALSSLAAASQIPDTFLFTEHVDVLRLDDWVKENKPPRLDLIKMDIEGAEIEALEGMVETLNKYRPHLLVQAYHIRDGIRTLEPCAAFLQSQNYSCREAGDSGMLVAKPL